MNELMRLNALIDVRPVLGDVRVPTLVLHNRRDPVVPFAAGRQLARRIPNARLVELDNGYHWGWGEHDNDVAIDEIVMFVSGERPTNNDVSDRVLATVLFTDIVGSTELAVAIGDHRWRQVFGWYQTSAMELVCRHRGRWVHSTGDGILATFDGPARAVVGAQALRDRAIDMGLTTRSGLHTGEVEAMGGGDISGIALRVAARIVAAAAPGEVWVSSAVPGLVAGSPLTFETRGSYALKGLPGESELFAVIHSGRCYRAQPLGPLLREHDDRGVVIMSADMARHQHALRATEPGLQANHCSRACHGQCRYGLRQRKSSDVSDHASLL